MLSNDFQISHFSSPCFSFDIQLIVSGVGGGAILLRLTDVLFVVRNGVLVAG